MGILRGKAPRCPGRAAGRRWRLVLLIYLPHHGGRPQFRNLSLRHIRDKALPEHLVLLFRASPPATARCRFRSEQHVPGRRLPRACFQQKPRGRDRGTTLKRAKDSLSSRHDKSYALYCRLSVSVPESPAAAEASFHPPSPPGSAPAQQPQAPPAAVQCRRAFKRGRRASCAFPPKHGNDPRLAKRKGQQHVNQHLLPCREVRESSFPVTRGFELAPSCPLWLPCSLGSASSTCQAG